MIGEELKEKGVCRLFLWPTTSLKKKKNRKKKYIKEFGLVGLYIIVFDFNSILLI